MDKLVLEKETEIQTEKEVEIAEVSEFKEEIVETVEVEKTQEVPSQTKYLSSLENMTIADFKKQEDEKKAVEFEKEKEVLIAQQYEKIDQPITEQVSQNIIEKPNYDLIEENKKIIKLKSKQQTQKKKKSNKKLATIAIACALGIGAVISVVNCAIIDNMSANYVQIDETYKLNLSKYLKNINNLDQAQNGMEMIETYPEEILDAGDVGEKSNWFDRLCNFIGGIFGG